MEVGDHEKHRTLLYYPSNAFRIGSAEELAFFKSKWNAKSDKKRVARIYRDFFGSADDDVADIGSGGTCPCRALFAFNVLDAAAFELDEAVESVSEDGDAARLTRFKFTNEYQLKTTFFPKRYDEDVRDYNVALLRNRLPDLAERCDFGASKNAAISTASKSTIHKKCVQNRRKLEAIEPVLRDAVRVCDTLTRDVLRIEKIAAALSTDFDGGLFRLLRTLRKRARAKFLKLDYFLRFRVVLSDVEMYLPKLPKNKKFKKNKDAVRARIGRDCLRFWGIERRGEATSVDRPAQLLPPNDNPSHDWYNLTSRCRHDGDVSIVHVQTRSNDEMISSFTFCESCRRRIA